MVMSETPASPASPPTQSRPSWRSATSRPWPLASAAAGDSPSPRRAGGAMPAPPACHSRPSPSMPSQVPSGAARNCRQGVAAGRRRSCQSAALTGAARPSAAPASAQRSAARRDMRIDAMAALAFTRAVPAPCRCRGPADRSTSRTSSLAPSPTVPGVVTAGQRQPRALPSSILPCAQSGLAVGAARAAADLEPGELGAQRPSAAADPSAPDKGMPASKSL